MKPSFKSILILFVIISFSCNREDKNKVENNKTEKATITIPSPIIINKGFGSNGKALWVTCKDHNKNTHIIISGITCETTYYEDHLTCVIPSQFIGKKIEELEVKLTGQDENTTSSRDIIITSCGLGGPSLNAIWVKCNNHNQSTKIFIDGKGLNTTYYKDHLTAIMPKGYSKKSSFKVILSDTISNKTSNVIDYRN